MSLVAVIRRLPGGSYVKTAKSGFMPAMPVETTFQNLGTFCSPWPPSRAKFLLYGTTRYASTFTKDYELNGKPKMHNKFNQSRMHQLDNAGDEMHVYGMTPPTDGTPNNKGGKTASGGGAAGASSKPLGLAGVMRRFRKGQKLSMLTAYDFPSARLARAANVEFVLVGDSIGNCRLGLPDTVGVTMDDISRATMSVRRGIDGPVREVDGIEAGPKPVIIGDMPFGSYLMEVDALKNAAALRIAGADMVKLEGGKQVAPLIRSLTNAGIAVMGHVGLEPQSALLQGGLKLQGTTADAAYKIVRDAQALAEAGAVSIVVECVPAEVGRAIQLAVPSVPVIGIGAGGEVAGQVLVSDDILALHGKPPSFAKLYADVGTMTANAFAAYVHEVQSGAFPGSAHKRNMKDEELPKLADLLAELGIGDAFLASTRAGSENNETLVESLPKRDWGMQSPKPSTLVKSRRLGINGTALPLSATVMEVRSKTFTPLQARALSKGASAPSNASNDVEILRTNNEVHRWRGGVGKVALVPTMGNLHEGHLELVEEAKRHADVVLVTIFVNPAQFAAHEDLDRYPRTLEGDLSLLKQHGVEAVFTPDPSEIYPSGSPGGTVVVPTFAKGKSEDATRPHFFTGVATVCLKLFNICRPDVVVFGQKDAMQCAVISHMLEDLMLSSHISLVVGPTSREADGLARSSRNSYLTPSMRKRAPAIYEALTAASQASNATPGSVRATVQARLEKEGMEVQYVSVADLREMDEKVDAAPLSNSVVSVACLLRDADQECRLIDNVVIPDSVGKGP